MKKLLSLCLVLLASFSLCACSSEEKGVKVIGIKNILSEDEFKQKLEESGHLEDLKIKNEINK